MDNEVTAGQGQDAQVTDNGQAPNGAAGEATAEQTTTPPLTLADVQAAINEALTGFTQQSQRTIQSQLDKRDSGLRKQIAELRAQAGMVTDQAKKRGIEEAQAAQIGQGFFTDNLDALLAAQPNGQKKPATQAGGADNGSDVADDGQPEHGAVDTTLVSEAGARLAAAYGLSQDDPEVKLVVTTGTPQAYLDSIQSAGQAKQQRLAKEQKQGRAARSPALGVDGGSAPRNPIADINSPGELYKLAAKQGKG